MGGREALPSAGCPWGLNGRAAILTVGGACCVRWPPHSYLTVVGEYTFVEALYCCVITGTTIGYGDYSPHVMGQ